MAKHRPTEYRYTYTGDPAVAASLVHKGKHLMRILQEKMSFQGNKVRSMSKRYANGTVTVHAHHGQWNMHIDAPVPGIPLAPCSARGFIFDLGAGKGYTESPTYVSVLSGDEIDELVAGRRNWYGNPQPSGDPPYLISWERSEFKYFMRSLGSSENFIYYRGCHWIKAPGGIQGAAIHDGFLVAVVNGNVRYIEWNPDTPYGEFNESGIWEQLGVVWRTASKSGFFINFNETYNASPDGALWHAHYFESQLPFYYELQISAIAGEIVILSTNSASTNSTSDFVGNNYQIPREDTFEVVFAPGTFTDNSTYAYYTADLIINPAYDGNNCETVARAISANRTGPHSTDGCYRDPCTTGPGPLPNGIRYWYWAYNHDVTKGSVDQGGFPLDPCADSRTETQTITNETNVWDTDWTANGTFDVIRDVGKFGGTVALRVRRETGVSSWRTGGDYDRVAYRESTQHHVSNYIPAAGARAQETVDGYQPNLTPSGLPCQDPLNPFYGVGYFSPQYHAAGGWPYVDREGTQTQTTTSSNWEEGSSNLTVQSWFAGNLLNLMEEQYSSRETTTNTEDLAGTYSDRIQYSAISIHNWDIPVFCFDCGNVTLNPNTGCGLFIPVTGGVVGSTSTSINGTRTYRMYMELDLKEEIALVVETKGTVNNNAWTWTTRLYWITPAGEFSVFANVPGAFIVNFNFYQSGELPFLCYYPVSTYKRFSKVYDVNAISDFQAQIIPREDEVLMYTKGTILGHQFDKLFSLQSAGQTIENAVSPDSPTGMKAV